tara:strand:- start:19182 stop:20474 length:1293 start_codon:yes stop_codon:yes gene_type:complete
MDILNDLEQRGLIKQASNIESLSNTLSNDSISLYCGFDPTADSLHVGSLLPMITLMRFKNAGHNPIALIGGATGMIGDPSFKSSERTLNDDKTVIGFQQKIQQQIENITQLDTVNNNNWCSNMNMIDFLRDVGKHFSINDMLRKESVRQRIEREDQGISFTEFSYMLIQSMDFLKLFENENCKLQIGGSDQWGNITAGMDLIHKVHGNDKDVFSLTFPLITKSDGTKFGKTESGTVWLSPEKTTPFQFFQFWLNTPDSDIANFFKWFSLKDISEINHILNEDENRKLQGQKPKAQELLAIEMTQLVHGKSGVKSAQAITNALFNGSQTHLEALEESDFEELVNSPDSFIIDDNIFFNMDLPQLIQEAGLAKSKTEARRFIQGNSISINDTKITDVKFDLNETKEHLFFNKFFILKRGKKNKTLISINKKV